MLWAIYLFNSNITIKPQWWFFRIRCVICQIKQTSVHTSECLKKIRAETAKDPERSALKEVVYDGWPTRVRELPLTDTTLLDLPWGTVHRRQLDLQGPPNCCSTGRPRRYPIQTTCQPPRYREDQAKGTHISVLEEPQQEHRRDYQFMLNMSGTPA